MAVYTTTTATPVTAEERTSTPATESEDTTSSLTITSQTIFPTDQPIIVGPSVTDPEDRVISITPVCATQEQTTPVSSESQRTIIATIPIVIADSPMTPGRGEEILSIPSDELSDWVFESPQQSRAATPQEEPAQLRASDLSEPRKTLDTITPVDPQTNAAQIRRGDDSQAEEKLEPLSDGGDSDFSSQDELTDPNLLGIRRRWNKALTRAFPLVLSLGGRAATDDERAKYVHVFGRLQEWRSSLKDFSGTQSFVKAHSQLRRLLTGIEVPDPIKAFLQRHSDKVADMVLAVQSDSEVKLMQLESSASIAPAQPTKRRALLDLLIIATMSLTQEAATLRDCAADNQLPFTQITNAENSAAALGRCLAARATADDALCLRITLKFWEDDAALPLPFRSVISDLNQQLDEAVAELQREQEQEHEERQSRLTTVRPESPPPFMDPPPPQGTVVLPDEYDAFPARVKRALVHIQNLPEDVRYDEATRDLLRTQCQALVNAYVRTATSMGNISLSMHGRLLSDFAEVLHQCPAIHASLVSSYIDCMAAAPASGRILTAGQKEDRKRVEGHAKTFLDDLYYSTLLPRVHNPAKVDFWTKTESKKFRQCTTQFRRRSAERHRERVAIQRRPFLRPQVALKAAQETAAAMPIEFFLPSREAAYFKPAIRNRRLRLEAGLGAIPNRLYSLSVLATYATAQPRPVTDCAALVDDAALPLPHDFYAKWGKYKIIRFDPG